MENYNDLGTILISNLLLYVQITSSSPFSLNITFFNTLQDVFHMRHAIISDGMIHARQHAMLKSCSGYQLR